jgi:hypothetical protein
VPIRLLPNSAAARAITALKWGAPTDNGGDSGIYCGS